MRTSYIIGRHARQGTGLGRTIINDDIKLLSCLVINDAFQESHICLVSHIQFAVGFSFNGVTIFLSTVCVVLNKRNLAVGKKFCP